MAWPRRQLAVAHRPQFAAKRLLGHADLKLLPQPLAKVDDTPAHDAVDSRDRSSLDGFCQRRTMSVIEPRRLTGGFTVDQAFGAARVELQHLVPDDLQRHAADLRCLCARRSIVNRCEC